MATATEPQHKSAAEPENRIANGLGWFSIGLGLAQVTTPGKMAKLVGVNDEARTRKLMRIYGMRELAAGIGILSQSRPSGWLWARVGGDLLDLSSLGKAMTSDDTERGRAGAASAAVVGITALDLYCAQRFSAAHTQNGSTHTQPTEVTSSIIIDRSPEEIYTFWGDFAQLPRILPQLQSVQVIGKNRSHWKMRAPIGRTVLEWDAEICEDQPNSYIGWHSLSSKTAHSVLVRLTRATGGRGTKVTLRIQSGAFAGKLGKLFGMVPEQQASVALHNLKQLLETGEVVHSDASIHPGMHPGRPPEEYKPQSQLAQTAASE